MGPRLPSKTNRFAIFRSIWVRNKVQGLWATEREATAH
jgi:hypothetical protein